MNRLILIGNGFDLAHGIKSSFNDFIEWYLAKVCTQYNSTGVFNDKLLSLSQYSTENIFNNKPKHPMVSGYHEKVFLDDLENETFYNNNNKSISPLLKNIIKRKPLWVDVEEEYFKVLCSLRKPVKDVFHSLSKPVSIDDLNDQFNYLRSQFLEYLQIQEKGFVNDFDKTELVNCFTEKITRAEGLTSFSDEKPKSIHFLNFNYTNTLEAYVEETSKTIPSTINYIHGNLDRSKGEPIFGYGDEMDKKFSEFEHDNDNRLFKHIKSFGYLKNSNYTDLLKFIEADNFQVHIYGHSCGLSDRTMLHEIFEHDNCKSIKIFFHEKDNGTNDFTDKTYEIYRHFNNKELVRKRIVDFSLSRPMPQPRKESPS